MKRRAFLLAAALAPLLAATRRASPVPPGWSETGTSDRLPAGMYLAAGSDRDLATALATVPAGAARAAVRIAN